MRRIWQRIKSSGQWLSQMPIDTSLVYLLVMLAGLAFAAVLADSMQRTYRRVTVGEKPAPSQSGPTTEFADSASDGWSSAWIVGLYAATAIVGSVWIVMLFREFRRRFSEWRTRRRLVTATNADEVQVSLSRLAEAQSSSSFKNLCASNDGSQSAQDEPFRPGPGSGAGNRTTDSHVI